MLIPQERTENVIENIRQGNRGDMCSRRLAHISALLRHQAHPCSDGLNSWMVVVEMHEQGGAGDRDRHKPGCVEPASGAGLLLAARSAIPVASEFCLLATSPRWHERSLSLNAKQGWLSRQGLRAEVGDAGLESIPAAVLGRVGPLYLFPPFPHLLPSAATDSRGQGNTVAYMGAWPAVGHGQSGWLWGAMAGLKEGSVCGKQSGQGDQQQSSCLGRGGELRQEMPKQSKGEVG